MTEEYLLFINEGKGHAMPTSNIHIYVRKDGLLDIDTPSYIYREVKKVSVTKDLIGGIEYLRKQLNK